jgi:HEAT repeat protein
MFFDPTLGSILADEIHRSRGGSGELSPTKRFPATPTVFDLADLSSDNWLGGADLSATSNTYDRQPNISSTATPKSLFNAQPPVVTSTTSTPRQTPSKYPSTFSYRMDNQTLQPTPSKLKSSQILKSVFSDSSVMLRLPPDQAARETVLEQPQHTRQTSREDDRAAHKATLEQCVHTLRQNNSDGEAQVAALQRIAALPWDIIQSSEALVPSLLGILPPQRKQSVDTIKTCLDILSKSGPQSQSAVNFIGVLMAGRHTQLHVLAVSTLLRCGFQGFARLLRCVSGEAATKGDDLILQALAAHPVTARVVLLPPLQRDCKHSDKKRRERALRTMRQLGTRASCKASLDLVTGLLCTGTVSRALAADCLRAMGPNGEHALVELATFRDPLVRIAALQALAAPTPVPEPLTTNPHYEHTPYANYVPVRVRPDVVDGGIREPVTGVTGGGDAADEGVILIDKRELLDLGRTISADLFSYCERLQKQQYMRYFALLKQYPPRFQQPDVHGGWNSWRSLCKLKRALKDKDPKVRLATVESTRTIAERVGGTAQLEHLGLAVSLLDGLGDTDRDVRLACIKSITAVGPAVQTQLAASTREQEDTTDDFLGDLNSSSRERAQSARRRRVGLGKRDLVGVLVGLLSDSYFSIRSSACVCLGVIGAAASVPHLHRMLIEASVKQRTSATALARLGNAGRRVLIDVLGAADAKKPTSRVEAALALGTVNIDGEHTGDEARVLHEVVRALLSVGADQDPRLRCAAIKSLARLGAKDNAHSLTLLRRKSLLPFFYTSMKDRDPKVRQEAAAALARSQSHGELLLVEAVLRDTNPLVRRAGLFGLGLIGPQTIRTVLLALLDEDSLVKGTACRTLLSLSCTEILEVLENRSLAQRTSVARCAEEVLESPEVEAAASTSSSDTVTGWVPPPMLRSLLLSIVDFTQARDLDTSVNSRGLDD